MLLLNETNEVANLTRYRPNQNPSYTCSRRLESSVEKAEKGEESLGAADSESMRKLMELTEMLKSQLR